MNKNSLQYRQEMHHLVTEWEQSGMSLRAYSIAEGASYEKLRYWKRKFRILNQTPSTNTPKETPNFISIEVPNNVEGFLGLQLTYPNQVKISCPSGIGLDALESLIKLF